MNQLLRDYFHEEDRFPDLASNPLYLAHIAEMGWILNEAILNREKETGLYIDTCDWKRRGEVAVALIMNYMNIIYNHHDNFRHSEKWKIILRNTLIATVTQFWGYRPFSRTEAAQSIRFMDGFYGPTANDFDDVEKLSVTCGVIAMNLESNETDAMLRLSGYAQGLLYETFM